MTVFLKRNDTANKYAIKMYGKETFHSFIND